MFDKQIKHSPNDVGEYEDWKSRSYDVKEKLTSELYSGDFLLDLQPQALTFQSIQENGLNKPIRITQRNGLGKTLFILLVNFHQIFQLQQCRSQGSGLISESVKF